MDRDEERRIIAQVCAGDANAFEALVVAYQKQVYNLALRTVGNEEDAADMTQEVFLRAYRALGTFRGESKFSVWLYRLTTNVCIDFLRSRRRHPTVSLTASEDDDEQPQFDLPADERTSPEQQLTRSEMRRAVARGLDSLPDDARKILILRELNGLSYAEIGKVLHLEDGTVKSRDPRLDQLAGGMITDMNQIIQKFNLPTTIEKHVDSSKMAGVADDFKMPQV